MYIYMYVYKIRTHTHTHIVNSIWHSNYINEYYVTCTFYSLILTILYHCVIFIQHF